MPVPMVRWARVALITVVALVGASLPAQSAIAAPVCAPDTPFNIFVYTARNDVYDRPVGSLNVRQS